LIVDSAGTGNWHAGEAPDERAQRTAMRNGVDISGLRAGFDVTWAEVTAAARTLVEDLSRAR
ncbi:MAG: hypothetical protein ACT6QM_15835, partial [Brevundimonas mediterranea]